MPNLDSVLAKLKKVLKCKNDLQLAEALGGISPSTISTWRKRNAIPYDRIEEVSTRMKIPFAWFVSDEDDGSSDFGPVLIPVLARIPADFLAETSKDDVSGYFSTPEAPQGAFALMVKDDSMSPTVRQDDYLFFLPGPEFKNGDFLVYQDEWGQVFARRCRERDGRLFMVADNPQYLALEADDKLKILGKVVDVWRRIKV
jgi:SOS-response transcriptional repressor LexA